MESPRNVTYVNRKMEQPTSKIQLFYKNRCVFITGATGFVGKGTVEKLLRTCPDLQTVYILIRPKKGSDVQARLNELLESSIFETIKEQNLKLLKKIVPIYGDITEPHLGISEKDQQILTEKVSVVIHSAATVRFDDRLNLSLNLNVQGTQRIVELCKRMQKLAFVHVSTAYANCVQEEIEEVVYPPPADPNDLLKLMEGMSDEEIARITPNLIGKRPNTYTFTKALAEHILAEEAQTIPICIVRPSIITATWKEPFPGWIDNLNAATGVMVAFGKGILRTMIVDPQKRGDLIPLDFTVNLILAAAWELAQKKPEGIKVYNCCSGTENPLTWAQFHEYQFPTWRNNPLSGVVWYPATVVRTNKMLHNINDFFLHFIPAYIMDTIAVLTGRKPVMLKIYTKILKAVTSLEYFSTNQWRFKTDNMVHLHEMLSQDDQQVFDLNVRKINWQKYMETYSLGIRKYTLKDNDSTLPAARKHVRKLFWVHSLVKFILILVIFGAIVVVYQSASHVSSRSCC